MVDILDNIVSSGGQGPGQQRGQVVWPHEGHWLPVLGSLHPRVVTSIVASIVTSIVTSVVVTVVIIRVVPRLLRQQPCIQLWKCAGGLQMQFPWDEKSILRIELDKICKYWQSENVNGQSKSQNAAVEDQTFKINRRQTLNEILSEVFLDKASPYPLTGCLWWRPNVGIDVCGKVKDGTDGDEEEGDLQHS